jgi:hypothetical protein
MAIRRNRHGQEIWFDRWLWSYMPCHWKGWALIAGVVTAGNAALWMLIWLLHAKDDDPRPFLVLIPTGLIGLVLAERHSTSKT